MVLEEALEVAGEFCGQIKELCEKIEIAGSIRRKKDFVNDIDLVIIPLNLNRLGLKINEISKVDKWGTKMISTRFKGQKIDIYLADRENFSTLLLIRTGSKQNNINLCQRARQLGMVLKADGSGLLKDGVRVNGSTEESIFNLLGIPYKEPWERE